MGVDQRQLRIMESSNIYSMVKGLTKIGEEVKGKAGIQMKKDKCISVLGDCFGKAKNSGLMPCRKA